MSNLGEEEKRNEWKGMEWKTSGKKGLDWKQLDQVCRFKIMSDTSFQCWVRLVR